VRYVFGSSDAGSDVLSKEWEVACPSKEALTIGATSNLKRLILHRILHGITQVAYLTDSRSHVALYGKFSQAILITNVENWGILERDRGIIDS
jgi:hypothetical protein